MDCFIIVQARLTTIKVTVTSDDEIVLEESSDVSGTLYLARYNAGFNGVLNIV